MYKLPKYWTEFSDGGYNAIKCPLGHNELKKISEERLSEYETIGIFKCKICDIEFKDKFGSIYSEEEIDYEQPGVVSEENGRSLIEYENHAKELRKKIFNQ